MKIDPRTPLLVGAGQTVERDSGATAPVALAAQAARRALEDCGGSEVAAHIDTVAMVRLFSDSSPQWACSFGRCDNPPESIARALGASPRSRIYTQVGGNEPQSRLIEFARDIAAGTREVVLFAGAEAIRNQRHAERAGRVLDWHESLDAPLEDRGYGKTVFATAQEMANGLVMPVHFYTLVEQARAVAAGRGVAAQRARMCALWESFARVAAANPYAQFPQALTAAEIDGAAPLTQLYSKRMIAQDGVNQGAALLLMSVAKADELGVPDDRRIFIHGMAEGAEPPISQRADPARSPVAAAVVERALAMAGRTVADIGPIDVYSCFPCAVGVVTDALGLPDDGSVPLTLTGGLPFFGGPGNNYSMHGLAEMVARLRHDARTFALVTANGGMVTKHAAGVYSRQPSAIDWTRAETSVPAVPPQRAVCAAPAGGRIISYCVSYRGDAPAQASVLAETPQGERFVAGTARGDAATVAAMLAADPVGRRVAARPGAGDIVTFAFPPD